MKVFCTDLGTESSPLRLFGNSEEGGISEVSSTQNTVNRVNHIKFDTEKEKQNKINMWKNSIHKGCFT